MHHHPPNVSARTVLDCWDRTAKQRFHVTLRRSNSAHVCTLNLITCNGLCPRSALGAFLAPLSGLSLAESG
jgi:hypothetical protein